MTSATRRHASRALPPIVLVQTIRYRLPFVRAFEPVVGSVTTIASDELESRSSSETSPYLSASREAIAGESTYRCLEGSAGRPDHDAQLEEVGAIRHPRECREKLGLAQAQLLGHEAVGGTDHESRRLDGDQLGCATSGRQMLLDEALPRRH